MSYRCSESYLVALDKEGNQYFVGYYYSFAGGYYSNVIRLGERKYEIEVGVDDYIYEKGLKLSFPNEPDIASYFDEPTLDMQRAIALAGVPSSGIEHFLLVDVDYVCQWATHIRVTDFSAVTTKTVHGEISNCKDKSAEDFAECILANGIDACFEQFNIVKQQ